MPTARLLTVLGRGEPAQSWGRSAFRGGLPNPRGVYIQGGLPNPGGSASRGSLPNPGGWSASRGVCLGKATQPWGWSASRGVCPTQGGLPGGVCPTLGTVCTQRGLPGGSASRGICPRGLHPGVGGWADPLPPPPCEQNDT